MLEPRDPVAARTGRAVVRGLRALVALALVLALVAGAAQLGTLLQLAPATPPGLPASGPAQAGATHPGGVDARIFGATPATWDPAAQGDQGTASTLAQVYETLTALDSGSRVQPALAASWTIENGGRRVVFTLRPNLEFSDGSPLTSADVVRSWLRLLDPQHPSPLASLLDGVVGAKARLAGRAAPDAVGIRAVGSTIVVDFTGPEAYFPAVAASPSLAVAPPSIGAAYDGPNLPPGFVGSGAYVPTQESAQVIRLEANPHYWAGRPPLGVIEIVTDTGGTPLVQAFESGSLDYTPVSASDASWIRYDATLGPQLREVPNPEVDYYGFDTTRPPFDDPRVRLAFAQAVDWRRLVRLASSYSIPATSMVPPGLPARSSSDYGPVYDPAAARAGLAAAGYPGGAGFPAVTLDSGGYPYDVAIAQQLKANLGVAVTVEELTSGYFERLASDPPQMWALSWVADYPDPQDFLGLLLTTGSSPNYGHWSNAAYDTAIAAAAATTDPTQRLAEYATAQRILQAQAPVIPTAYQPAWALSRNGLLGAGASGVGILRYASLAWSP